MSGKVECWKTWDELPEQPELPSLIRKRDGSLLSSPEEWPEQREYLKEMLGHYMYGPLPPTPENTRGIVLESCELYDGKAIRETVRIECGPGHGISFLIYVIRPNKPGRFPVLVLNAFSARQFSPEMKKSMGVAETGEQLPFSSPIEEEIVCARNYVLTLYECVQLATDEPESTGPVDSMYPERNLKSIAIWAWGQMRVFDYLETQAYADPQKLLATGHSRFGKVALCTAIYDGRVALCAANGSGCGGAGCYRFLGGRDGQNTGYQETLGGLTTMFPHWFSDEMRPFGTCLVEGRPDFSAFMKDGKIDVSLFYQTMAERYPVQNERRLPFDLHTVRALIAPRPLITSEGLDDEWANPYGAQVTWAAAQEIYRLLGAEDNHRIHFREGPHQYGELDWRAVLDFADQKL